MKKASTKAHEIRNKRQWEQTRKKTPWMAMQRKKEKYEKTQTY